MNRNTCYTHLLMLKKKTTDGIASENSSRRRAEHIATTYQLESVQGKLAYLCDRYKNLITI